MVEYQKTMCVIGLRILTLFPVLNLLTMLALILALVLALALVLVLAVFLIQWPMAVYRITRRGVKRGVY